MKLVKDNHLNSPLRLILWNFLSDLCSDSDAKAATLEQGCKRQAATLKPLQSFGGSLQETPANTKMNFKPLLKVVLCPKERLKQILQDGLVV